MHRYKVIGILVLLCCELCLTIRVPTVWTDGSNSAVNNEPNQVEIIQPQNVQTLHQLQPIPIEYFQYTAPKPQFAVDIAAYHGVNNPQEHFKAHPVKPVSEEQNPVLGIHQMLNQDQTIYHPYQNYVKKGEKTNNHVQPVSTRYEIFHPYVAEQPALQQLYKDPTLTKIRNDLKHTKDRLQTYEEQAGQPNISDDEYLEGQQKTDKKLFPQKNIPARYEIHKAERRPIYYQRPYADSHREQILNRKFKHPWNQQNIKIRPLHYKPLKNHIHNLRQQHAMKYDDERNEYPQIIVNENSSDPEEGQDIYEAGKQKYTQLRDDFDLSVNKAKQLNRPVVYENLEMQKNEPETQDVEDEFIPIKNYAQVRKSETFKHVPRKAAFDDAETFEEILNAPRLREAIKSSKAQIVYSEEGYEDSAYDHAGEQKHASNHEGHGGFLKQKENSSGLYKIPKVLDSYQDNRGSEYRDNTEHAERWKNNNKDNEEESEAEDYSKEEYNESVDADISSKRSPTVTNRSKREQIKTLGSDNSENTTLYSDNNYDEMDESDKNEDTQHDVDKRETNFKVPEINLDSTLLTEKEIIKMAKLKLKPKIDTIKDKYPYYYKTLKKINKDSPLRYAENLRHIPKKSEGGTEFYDSRSNLECPEVESDVDPIPDKLKNDDDPTDEDNQEGDENKNNFAKKQPRLNSLGDKIDCFKAKYFGENPLDSPFFKEEIIASPEPIIIPKLSIHNSLKINNKNAQRKNQFEKNYAGASTNIFELLDKLRLDTNKSKESFNVSDSDIKLAIVPQNDIAINSTQQSDVYADVLTHINSNMHSSNTNRPSNLTDSTNDQTNLTYNFYQNKEEVTRQPQLLRKKRSTPFIYEPYKIIKDSQLQDSKKTTTTSNISPLIRQLQSSRVVDRVSRSNREEKQTRPGVSSRSYVDIGKKDRDKSPSNPAIVDVSVDQRRGEPRYEIRPHNHKSEYTPVQNKKTMSVEDYKTRTEVSNSSENRKKQEVNINRETRNQQRSHVRTTIRPYYDVSSFLPSTKSSQNVAESNSIKNSVTTIKPGQDFKPLVNVEQASPEESEESDEDYEEEDDENEEDQVNIDISTTTTSKPSFRIRTKAVPTTENPRPNNEDEPERLRLITRFRNYKPREKVEKETHNTEPTTVKKYEQDVTMPKYREKKKKSSESTLVTDTKKYGDDDDENDMRKEVDALIGVQHNMDDYTPLYEKEEEQKGRKYHHSRKNDEDSRERNNNDEDDEERIPDDDDDSDEDDDDDDDDDEDDDEEEEYEEEEDTPVVTTPEPTKRTLVKTTDAPFSTTASYVHTTATPSRGVKSEIKPIITRKKIEIHKELPVNKSSPHVTQFKQDIKEVEIIKESPVVLKRKPHKKGEALELYKDDNLAKDVNKLGDVEIFNENIDLDAGRKHGGNYRKATKEDLRLISPRMQESQKALKDTETSQTENQKHVEFDQYTPQQMHGGNFKSISDIKRTRNSGRNAKLVELSESPIRSMHGGNLKVDSRKRGGRRNEKLVELDDHHDDDRDSSQDDNYKSSQHNPRTDRLHGGNYRSGKLIAAPDKENDDIKVRTADRDARKKAAALLNSYAQAVPVLTTTPAYILDPSKRMYYYVDA